MEPEDMPWPGELEEEVEEEEEEAAENLDEYEVVMVEEMEEEEGREPDADFNYESQRRESTDDEEDEEAKAWLQAHPAGTLPQPSLPRHRYSVGELTTPGKVVPLTCHVWQQPLYQNNSGIQIPDTNVVSLEKTAQWGSGDDQRTESWHYLPQEMDSSHTLDTTQTRFNVREKGTEVTDFPSLEEGILIQSENQVKESNRDLLCSPLLVIQDNFASPDLPLLTCLTKDQEFGPDSLFHRSELDFAPLRGIPGKSEDTEWFSRPSEVSEALFQAASEVASNLVNSCFSVSQHPLIGSTAIESQRSLLTLEQGTEEETVSPDTLEDLKTPKDSDSYDALYSYMSWKTQEVIQEPETNLADKDQVSFSTASDTSDEYVTPKGSDSFDASCSYVQYGKQEALQQLEKYLTSKDRDSYSDSSDTIDKNKIPKESDNFSAPFSDMPWSKQGASHHPEICLISKDCVSFPREVAPRFYSKMPHCFLHCLLERGGREVPLTADSHYFESVYLRAPAENEMKQKMDSLEGYKRNEEDLGKELSQCFELKENRNTLGFSEVHPRSSEIQYIENVVVTDNSVEVPEAHILSRGHDTSKMEVSGGPLHTIKSSSDETSEQLCFQEERNQKPPSAFGGKNVDATENVAFQAVIASIEPSEKESTVNEIQTDINKSLTNDSQESEPKNPDLSLLNYYENFFFDKLNHPPYQSTPGVFESAASKPLLYKKDDGDSSLYWHPNLKSLPSAPQEILITPLSLSPELKSSSSLSEKSLRQAVGLGKTQSALFQYDTDNEPFLPIGKIKSVSALDLAEKLGSSNIIYPMKIWTSDSLVLQDLKQHTFEEVADSSNCILEGLQGKAESDIYTVDDDTECCSLDENAVVCRKRVVELQREIRDQGDLTGECIKLAGLENLLDDLEICDSSLHWQSTVQLPSKEESSFEEPVYPSNMDINQSFSSVLPLFVPHEPTRELEYHSSDLRMLRVSPDTVPGTLKHSTGDTSKGDIAEIPQSTLKPGITTTPEDSDTVSHLSLSPEDFPQLAGRSPQVKNIGQHTDTPNQQTLADSHLTEEALKVSAVPGLADQKTGIATVPSSSYSQRGKPNIFYPQGLPDGHLTEEALKVAAVPGLGDQKTSISTVPPSSYSLGEKHSIFYPQALPDGHQTEEGLNVSVLLGLADLKTGKPTVPASSYSVGEEPGIFYQQALPGSHLPEEALKVSPSPRPVDKKTGLPTASSTSYSHGEKPRIFYQQTLPESHLTEQALKVSAASGPPEQKTGIPIVTSTSYSHSEKLSILCQQELPDSHLTEQAQKVSAAPGLAEQKTGIPTVHSTSYLHREKPSIVYQQELPDNHLIQQVQQVSAAPGLAEQKTGILTVPSTSYSHREKPTILYQQELPDSHVIQEVQQVSAAPGLAEQKTGIPIVTSTSYSHREKPSILYQQELPDSHLTEQAQKVSPAPGPPEQKTGIPIVTSTSYSHREKPSIFYQQNLPDSHLTKKAQKVPALPGLAHQKSGTPIAPPAFYAHRGKTSVMYQQELPDSHLSDQTQKISAIPGPVDQNTGIQTVPSGSYSQREKPIIFYRQELPDSLLTEEAVKVSAFPRTADQNTGIPTGSSRSYSFGEKPGGFFYQQVLPDSNLSEEALKVSPVSRPSDQKTGILSVPASSYSHREKHSIFYPQTLPGSHLSEEALKDSAISGLADQKTGTSESSGSYSHREKSSVFYQQELPDSHLTGEAQKVSGVTGTGDQKTGIPILTSNSYLHKEKPIIFYQQALPDRYLTEEALNVSAAPGPADQKAGIPAVPSSSYSYREKPIISYQQELPDLTQVALKVLEVPGPADQKIGIPSIISTSSSYGEKPIISYQQELPDPNEDALKHLELPGQADQTTGMRTVPPTSYSHRESPIFSYQKELPDITEETLKVSAVPGPADQKIGIQTVPSSSYSYREKADVFYQQELPDLTEETLKVFALPGPADQNAEIPTGPSSSYSHKEKLKILPDDQKAELLSAPLSSYSHREKPKTSTVIGPDDQKTPLLTGFPNSYSQRVKPSIFFKQQLPDGHQSGDILKISPVPEPTDVNSWIQIPLSSSYSQREKSNIFYPEELPDKHLTEDSLKVSTVPGPADQKTVLPAVPPSSFSLREKPILFYQQDLPERHLTENNLKFSSSLGQAGQITGLSTVPPSTYSHSEKHKLVSDHVQRLIDNLDSSNASVISNNMPLNSQADGTVVINKPESSGFEDVGSKEIQDTENSSKTLKEVQTLLMEAENIALRRCNFPVPLVPFRDVSDISFIQSKKVVCCKEPPTADASNGDLSQRQPFTEESPSNKCIQKDISTQTNLKCQRGTENWEFISSTTVRSPLQEAESKARVALDETLRQCKAARSVMRSDPEGYSRTIENKIVIPMMTVIKSDSSSDASSCSWDSNSLESVSDVLLNFFPNSSPKTSMTDSREEEGVLESDDGGGSSVDSLAAHVKNLLKCESSLNRAKQILRNAEEEESRVRARAWNLKFNMAHECGYSISELNEDDRRKVEEIKAKLFGHGRTTDLPKGLQSPQGIGCKPEAVCSHIIIESHEKGCFRTLTAELPQLDSHPCVFRSAEPSEMIRGQRSPSSWTTRHINLAKSLDQNNSHFKVWNSLQLQSHSPFQNFIGDDLKISKGLRMPFREKLDPWLSELVEPACMPPEEMDCQSSSQMLPPEPMKKFTTSITFSSHRHSKCFSDSSFLKVGVTEGSQCTGASVGVVNSHITEEQNPPRDLKEKTSSPSSFKIISQSPDKAVTILAENSRESQKLSVEHSHQEEKPLERSDFKGSHSKPSTSANDSNFKEVHFSDDDTVISMGRPSSTLGVKEKNVTITPDLPLNIFLEQELFEQSKASHADHHVRKHNSPPPQHQDYVAPNLPCRIFLEKRELFKQSKTQHKDNQLRENHSPLPQSQDYIASDLPSPIFLEQRQLFEQSKAPDVDHHMGKHHSPLPQGQDCIVEKNNEHKPKLHISDMINVEAKFSDVASPSARNQCTVVTSASTPPSNTKALSCVRITLCPKTPSRLDSGTLDKRFHSLDPASKTRMNSEFNSGLQTVSSESLEPTSKLLTSKPVAQDQESLGFLGPKSSLDFQVVQSPLPDSNIISQDLKTIPFQNSQIVTSRQTQVNISDLEGYSNPEGTPVSAVRSPKEIKTPFSPFSGKLSSDAVTQITTESPGKAMFSSEIFVNAEDRGHDIPELSTQKSGKVPVKFASSSSVQQITVLHGTDGQPLLLPYKPSGSTKMYYVPQLRQIPSSLDSKSDTTIESSHSGSNDAIAPDFPAQVLGTRDEDVADTVNIKHKEGIYSKRVVTKASLSMGKKPFQKDNADAQVQVLITGDEDLSDKNQKKEIYSKRAVTEAARSEEKESLQKDTTGSRAAAASEQSAQLQDTKIDNLADTKAIKQKGEIHSKRTVPKEAWPEEKKSLQIDIAESRCHSEFENTTHSVFRSAKFYFHHPVHLPSDQDFCHESLGRRVFLRHSWKDSFQHHPDKQREHTCLPSSYQNVAKTKSDYTTIESLSINVNLENKEVQHTTKSQARDFPKYDKQVNDLKRDRKATPELTTQHTVNLNELWNRYQERQRQQKPPEFSAKKELSLVERLDRLAKLLQRPITHSLQPSESTQDDSKGEQDVKEWSGRRQQQNNKLQKKKRYKSLEKCHKNTGDLKKNKVLSTHQARRSNQIKIEQIKFDKYILRKQPGFHYINNTSSDSRHSEESELLTDTATNILSTTTSVESDILTQTDKELTLHERSSSISTIDTARLIHAFGHERVCLSPRRIKLDSSITDHQRRYLEKRSEKNKKPLNTGYPQITSEHTRRKHIQVTDHISSDSVSSSTSSFWSSSSTLGNKQNVHMLNKGIQAGTLEIVNGVRKHTRDVGMTFPTPSSSEARVEEDSDVTSWSEEKIEEKRLLTNYLGDRKLRKNKQSCWEGVSWFVPVENVKSGPKKENLPEFHGPGASCFAPVTNTTPGREPLQEQNWQGQHTDSRSSLAGPGRDPLKPFVRATLQESLQLHRPDFISRSGERIKRLKFIVQERKLQNMLQSEREALFNTVRGWQGHRDATHLLPKRGFLVAQKKRPVGKKEMIQRSKWKL
ncbi:centrosome-associated protein ALMS1 isoform X3 [Balaenoptera acutorostrata]|uniref:Centrosome-associated protein ALMS1 isoform X3 n=1 Tax=Balaenoptera acutorostrata TaxID=9767 RepID=A0ABM3UJE4_BALAC|nr:centrosome-associated protein ALMS1 isoform X3 [Balaenoptera acutorostrata]